MVLQDHGLQVFDEDDSLLLAKARICMSRADYDITYFNIGALGEDKVSEYQGMLNSPHNSFPVTDCLVYPATYKRRKREEEETTPSKIPKYNSHDNSSLMNPSTSGVRDALISGSKVNYLAHDPCTEIQMENAIGDDNDEEMEILG